MDMNLENIDLEALLTPEQFELAAKHFLNPNQWIFESHPKYRSEIITTLRGLVIKDVGYAFNRIDLKDYIKQKQMKRRIQGTY